MKKCLSSRRGTTLVELLVAFALLSIFMAAAAAVITPATRVFLKVKYLTYAQNVGDMVMEKVAGEIGSAISHVVVSDGTVAGTTVGGEISFYDSAASPVYIHKNDKNLLNIHYRKVKASDGGTAVLWPAADWGYDSKAYQGFTIDTLTFERVSDSAVRINLSIQNQAREVEYTSTRVVECYTVSEAVRIGPVYLDDDEFYNKKGP